MSRPSPPRGPGRTRRALCRLILALDLAIVVALAGYVGAYAAARAGGWIVHESNYRHWHPEKRSPEHYVGSDLCVGVRDRAMNSFFKPLRVLEEAYHRAVNPR